MLFSIFKKIIRTEIIVPYKTNVKKVSLEWVSSRGFLLLRFFNPLLPIPDYVELHSIPTLS